MLGFCVAVAYQRSQNGVHSDFLLLALLVAPNHLRRLRSILGKGTAPPWWTVLFELLAFAGVRSSGYAVWGLPAGFAACLAGTLPGDDEPAAHEPLLSRSVLAVAGVALGFALYTEQVGAWLRMVLFVPVCFEALRPQREKTRFALRTRVAVGLVLVVPTLSISRIAPIHAVFASALAVAAVLSLLRGRAARAAAVKRVALGVGALLVSWVAAEIVFRFVPNRYTEGVGPEAVQQPFHEPGAEYVYRGVPLAPKPPPDFEPVRFRWNAHGFHDVDHDLAKPANTIRVLVIGDSYVEGLQVPTDALYHRVLEQELSLASPKSVETIAYGWSGWGQRQECVALFEGSAEESPYPSGLSYAPDLVLVEFLSANDVQNNSTELEGLAHQQEGGATLARVAYLEAVRLGLHFSSAVFDKLDVLTRSKEEREAIGDDVYRKTPRRHREAWREAWRVTEDLLRELQAKLAERGVALVVVVFTQASEIEAWAGENSLEDFDHRIPGVRVQAICKGLGVPCLDLGEVFGRLPPEVRKQIHLHPFDGHWSKLGHRLGAEATARFLRESGVWARLRR